MKLLILTQSVDRNNPVLGFFHEWVREFSNKSESVTVVCLEKGDYDLPSNVEILSLGKEQGVSKFKYIINFYTYIYLHKKNYDAVFVHMNEEYVLLGGLFWRLMGKKIFLWRNHISGSWKTRIAVYVANEVFCTSKMSYTARFRKTSIMPVGVDDDFFKAKNLERNRNNILYVGRIAPVKKIEIIIDAMEMIVKRNHSIRLNIFGPIGDSEYFNLLKDRIAKLSLTEHIEFKGAVNQRELTDIYNTHGICINTTNSGSFDKTIIESAFCAILPIVSNTNFTESYDKTMRDIIEFKEYDPKDLSYHVLRASGMSDIEYNKVTSIISTKAREMHSLSSLVSQIILKI